MSPLATFERGYAIVTRLPEGEIVRDAARVAPGCEIDTRLARGRLRCFVEAYSRVKGRVRRRRMRSTKALNH